MTLVEFLKARLDEDEQVAKAASDPGGPHLPAAQLEHARRHDPARVLAEVEAKRRIIDAHHPVDPCDAHDASFETISCDTLLLLALPYADHSDYDEAWRP
jgi:hypothetical protein